MMPARGGRPLLLIDLAVPRDIDPTCARAAGRDPATTSTTCRRQVARNAARAPRRGAQGRGHRRGGDPGVRAAGSARSRCCRRSPRCARAATRRRRAAGRERGPLGVAVRARPRARRGARARRREPAAARADRCACRQLDARAPPRAPAAAARAVRARGARPRPSRRGGEVRAPRRRDAVDALRIGTRGSALALAQARCGGRARSAAREIVDDHHRRRPRRAAPATSRAGSTRIEARAARRARSTSRCTRRRTSRASWPTGTLSWRRRARADPRDALVGARALDALPRGRARRARASLRRRAQLLAVRPDLDVVELRGNVDTRLRKLDAGEVDAIVLAAAGLERLGRRGRPADAARLRPRAGPGHARDRGAGG